MDVDIGAPSDLVSPNSYTWDDSYIENIKLDSILLNSQKKVFKESLSPGLKSGPLLIQGRKNTPTNKTATLLDVENNIRPLTHSQPVSYKDTPIGHPRGKGQAANMDNTNAAGYAWLAGISDWNRAKWEWLHIRGASLGGHTDGSNLVAGTADCNTHMIPFESNIRSLATIAGSSPNYNRLDVEYSIDRPNNPATHVVENIIIDWKLEKSNTAASSTYEPEGKATFKPLETASNISKKEVELLEEALKDKRDLL